MVQLLEASSAKLRRASIGAEEKTTANEVGRDVRYGNLLLNPSKPPVALIVILVIPLGKKNISLKIFEGTMLIRTHHIAILKLYVNTFSTTELFLSDLKSR